MNEAAPSRFSDFCKWLVKRWSRSVFSVSLACSLKIVIEKLEFELLHDIHGCPLVRMACNQRRTHIGRNINTHFIRIFLFNLRKFPPVAVEVHHDPVEIYACPGDGGVTIREGYGSAKGIKNTTPHEGQCGNKIGTALIRPNRLHKPAVIHAGKNHYVRFQGNVLLADVFKIQIKTDRPAESSN